MPPKRKSREESDAVSTKRAKSSTTSKEKSKAKKEVSKKPKPKEGKTPAKEIKHYTKKVKETNGKDDDDDEVATYCIIQKKTSITKSAWSD